MHWSIVDLQINNEENTKSIDYDNRRIYELLQSDESYRIERTVSTGNMDKFQEAICAFANDLPGSRKRGYLLIGVHVM